MKREVIKTEEFDEFFNSLSHKVQTKVDYALFILQNLDVISAKLVKKLVGTSYYELRISIDNEYRIILFAADHDNIIQASQIFLLNGFVKKSTGDYKKQIAVADRIIKHLEQ